MGDLILCFFSGSSFSHETFNAKKFSILMMNRSHSVNAVGSPFF